nr:MAG TPA_asm: hypothetical protein [Caudoviricetes sp.]
MYLKPQTYYIDFHELHCTHDSAVKSTAIELILISFIYSFNEM